MSALPLEVFYLILEQTAIQSPLALIPLASTCHSLYQAYKTFELKFLQSALQSTAGEFSQTALAAATFASSTGDIPFKQDTWALEADDAWFKRKRRGTNGYDRMVLTGKLVMDKGRLLVATKWAIALHIMIAKRARFDRLRFIRWEYMAARGLFTKEPHVTSPRCKKKRGYFNPFVEEEVVVRVPSHYDSDQYGLEAVEDAPWIYNIYCNNILRIDPYEIKDLGQHVLPPYRGTRGLHGREDFEFFFDSLLKTKIDCRYFEEWLHEWFRAQIPAKRWEKKRYVPGKYNPHAHFVAFVTSYYEYGAWELEGRLIGLGTGMEGREMLLDEDAWACNSEELLRWEEGRENSMELKQALFRWMDLREEKWKTEFYYDP